jgi:lysozyme family protein
MADFNKAWDKTSKNEGGYVNNSKDRGKETYRGITIASNPNWNGWSLIHKVIINLGITYTLDAGYSVWKRITDALAGNVEVNGLVSSLYKKNYWDPINLDNEPDQLIAEQVFDTAVNMGVETAKQLINEARKENA